MIDADKYTFNLLPSPIDSRDFLLESIYPETVKLPDVWDLRPQMRPIRDQGTQGTCSAQTIAAIKEWQELADIGFKEYMSPQFVYNLRENQGTEGMYPRDTMEILYKVGIVPEKQYKYGTFTEINNELKEQAQTYKIQGYAQINTFESAKKALFANGPCYIAFPVYNPNKMEFWKPDFTGQQMSGGHAVCLAGYTKDAFIIRNSWSTQWGDAGYTYYPFSDFGMHWEIWTSIDADSNSKTLSQKIHNIENKKNIFKRIFSKNIKK
jgi:hypothetical protein